MVKSDPEDELPQLSTPSSGSYVLSGLFSVTLAEL